MKNLDNQLQSSSEVERKHAYDKLADEPIESQIYHLIKNLKINSNPQIRIEYCNILAKFGEKSVSELKLILRGEEFQSIKHWRLRASVAFTLGVIGEGSKTALYDLIDALFDDPNEIVRYESVTAIGNLNLSDINDRKKTARKLIDRMENDKSPVVRKRSVLSLGKLKLTNAIEAILEAMKDRKNKRHRFYFVYALILIDDGKEGIGSKMMRKMAERRELDDREMFILQDLYRKWYNDKKITEVQPYSESTGRIGFKPRRKLTVWEILLGFSTILGAIGTLIQALR